MKKNIILAIALMVICLQQLSAQDSVAVSPAVAKRFQEAFAGAKNALWSSLPKKVTQVQFYYKGAGWLAYFDGDGNIITCGRRIKSVDELPLKVQEGVRRARARIERKGGSYQAMMIYEMMKEEHTRYFITFQSPTERATFSISSDGYAALELRKSGNFTTEAPKDVIAKKN